jgi:hypothetical protein
MKRDEPIFTFHVLRFTVFSGSFYGQRANREFYHEERPLTTAFTKHSDDIQGDCDRCCQKKQERSVSRRTTGIRGEKERAKNTKCNPLSKSLVGIGENP